MITHHQAPRVHPVNNDHNESAIVTEAQPQVILSSDHRDRAKYRHASLKEINNPSFGRTCVSFYERYLSTFALNITESTWFQTTIIVAIFGAGISVGLQSYKQLDGNFYVTIIDNIILLLFILECLLKIISYGAKPWQYWIGPEWGWNNFDFWVVVFSLPGILPPGTDIAFLRLMRLMRVTKLVGKVKELEVIVKGLIAGLVSVSYISMLWILILFLYAVVGVTMFKQNDPAHFGNVLIAMITLFRCTTLEDWSDVMYINYYGCDEYPGGVYSETDKLGKIRAGGFGIFYDYDCNDPYTSDMMKAGTAAYFVSFIFMTTFTILSLFVGAVSMGMMGAMNKEGTEPVDAVEALNAAIAHDKKAAFDIKGEAMKLVEVQSMNFDEDDESSKEKKKKERKSGIPRTVAGKQALLEKKMLEMKDDHDSVVRKEFVIPINEPGSLGLKFDINREKRTVSLIGPVEKQNDISNDNVNHNNNNQEKDKDNNDKNHNHNQIIQCERICKKLTAEHGNLSGAILVKINYTDLSRITYDQGLQLLNSPQRPLNLTFRKDFQIEVSSKKSRFIDTKAQESDHHHHHHHHNNNHHLNRHHSHHHDQEKKEFLIAVKNAGSHGLDLEVNKEEKLIYLRGYNDAGQSHKTYKQVEESLGVKIEGAILTKINGTFCNKIAMRRATGLLRSSHRPMNLWFEKGVDKSITPTISTAAKQVIQQTQVTNMFKRKEEFTMTIKEPGSLGLNLDIHKDKNMIRLVDAIKGGQAEEAYKELRAKHHHLSKSVLTKIGDTELSTKTMDERVELLKSTIRPLVLTFERLFGEAQQFVIPILLPRSVGLDLDVNKESGKIRLISAVKGSQSEASFNKVSDELGGIKGSQLVKINEIELSKASLDEAKHLLTSTERPMMLTFEKHTLVTSHNVNDGGHHKEHHHHHDKMFKISINQPGSLGLNLDVNKDKNMIRLLDAIKGGQAEEEIKKQVVKYGTTITGSLLKKINSEVVNDLGLDKSVILLKSPTRPLQLLFEYHKPSHHNQHHEAQHEAQHKQQPNTIKEFSITILKPGALGLNLDINKDKNIIKIIDAIKDGQAEEEYKIKTEKLGQLHGSVLTKINNIEIDKIKISEAVDLLKSPNRPMELFFIKHKTQRSANPFNMRKIHESFHEDVDDDNEVKEFIIPILKEGSLGLNLDMNTTKNKVYFINYIKGGQSQEACEQAIIDLNLDSSSSSNVLSKALLIKINDNDIRDYKIDNIILELKSEKRPLELTFEKSFLRPGSKKFSLDVQSTSHDHHHHHHDKKKGNNSDMELISIEDDEHNDKQFDDDESPNDPKFTISILKAGSLGLNLDINKDKNIISFVDCIKGGQSEDTCKQLESTMGPLVNSILVKINSQKTKEISINAALFLLKSDKRPLKLTFLQPSTSKRLEKLTKKMSSKNNLFPKKEFQITVSHPRAVGLKFDINKFTHTIRLVDPVKGGQSEGAYRNVEAELGVLTGSELIKIGNTSVNKLGLISATKLLQSSKRPLILTFERKLFGHIDDESDDDSDVGSKDGSFDPFSISYSLSSVYSPSDSFDKKKNADNNNKKKTTTHTLTNLRSKLNNLSSCFDKRTSSEEDELRKSIDDISKVKKEVTISILKKGSLGMNFDINHDYNQIRFISLTKKSQAMTAYDNACTKVGDLKGAKLVKINDSDLESITLKEAEHMLGTKKRPLHLTFQKKVTISVDGSHHSPHIRKSQHGSGKNDLQSRLALRKISEGGLVGEDDDEDDDEDWILKQEAIKRRTQSALSDSDDDDDEEEIDELMRKRLETLRKLNKYTGSEDMSLSKRKVKPWRVVQLSLEAQQDLQALAKQRRSRVNHAEKMLQLVWNVDQELSQVEKEDNEKDNDQSKTDISPSSSLSKVPNRKIQFEETTNAENPDDVLLLNLSSPNFNEPSPSNSGGNLNEAQQAFFKDMSEHVEEDSVAMFDPPDTPPKIVSSKRRTIVDENYEEKESTMVTPSSPRGGSTNNSPTHKLERKPSVDILKRRITNKHRKYMNSIANRTVTEDDVDEDDGDDDDLKHSFVCCWGYCPQSIADQYELLSIYAEMVAESNHFDYFITVVILLAGVLVGLGTAYSSPVLNYLNNFTTMVFIIEVFVKVIAKGETPSDYFIDNWNKFDFSIVVAGLIPQFLGLLGFSVGGLGAIAILRLLRLLRALKLLKAVPQLQIIVLALLQGMSSMGYISVMIALVLYVFAIIAMIFFSTNDPWHFGSLHMAILTLFQCATLDDWTDVMYINMFGCDRYPAGYPITHGRSSSGKAGYGPDGTCNSPNAYGYAAALFFIFFVVLGALVLLTLFVGVVNISMEEAKLSLNASRVEEEKLAIVIKKTKASELHVIGYRQLYMKLDTNRNGALSRQEITPFLSAINPQFSAADLENIFT